MSKFLRSVFILSLFFSIKLSAQSPNISYQSPQKLYIEKSITPVTVKNIGGAVPNRIYPQANILPLSGQIILQSFVRLSSGDIFGIEYANIYHIKPDGTMSVFAGNNAYGYADGTGIAASFGEMGGIANDAAGNLYVTDNNSRDGLNSRVRKITPAGVVTTYAQGLRGPEGIAVDGNGIIYVSQAEAQIMKIAKDGTVSLLAGKTVTGKDNGTGANASFNNPVWLTLDKTGNIYVADIGNNLIRKITPAGEVTTVAGSSANGSQDGIGAAASFSSPSAVQVDSKGNLIIADGGSLMRKISPTGDVTTIAGPTYYDDKGQTIYTGFGSPFILDNNDDIIAFTGYRLYKILTTGYNIAPALPQGLTFGTDGTISGTPAALSASATYKISAANTSGISSTNIILEVVVPPDPPVISSISPASAYADSYITITGKYFTGATAVTIGGKPTPDLYTISPTSISAMVPEGAASGEVTVTSPQGTGHFSGFTFIPAPTISSISPASAWKGATITITGTDFTGTSQVLIGGYYASSFKVISPTKIEATVGDGATGDISVYAPSGGASIHGFTYISPPSVSSASPSSGAIGTTVTINGSNFTNTTSVKFGTTDASSFSVVSATKITAVIAAGSSNNITVTTPAGSSNYYFTYIPPPTITSASPMKGGYNSSILISGSGLNGAQVSIGGVPASIIYGGDYQIYATVGSGASSGNITIVTNGGTATLAGFTWVPAPQITSFTPQIAGAGDKVTITGTDLTEVDYVSFGGISSAFTVISPTIIEATVGNGTSGSVTVLSEGGSATLPGFTHTGPTIDSFLPVHAAMGETVTIKGNNFTGATEVDFGGVPATSFTVNSSTGISAVVGAGKSGSVTVITPLGKASLAGFDHPGPLINSFNPAYAGASSTSPITITGSNFTGATAVSFGGVPAASFTVVSATSISATPATSTSGDVSVTTPQGTDKKSGFTWVQAPAITSFSPASQQNGGSVTITGTNFIGVTSVKLGGVPALYYSAYSPTTINVVVGNGASGDIIVSTVGGSATVSGFNYTTPAIQSVDPVLAATGQTVTITGTNLDAVQSVTFGGINAASFSIVSPQKITAVVGTGASGNVAATSLTGTASFPGFTFMPPPVIYSFTPASGGAGTEVSINGSNLTSTSEVLIGGVAATITSVANNQVKAKAGSGASGKVSLKTIAGTAELDGFTWYPVPTITSADPLTANSETTVTINGTNFTGVTEVKFGSSDVGFTIISPTQITAQPSYASSGDITVISPGGTAVLPGFIFLPAPVISSFTTTGEGANSSVTITGSNFNNVTEVKFGGVQAKSFKVLSTGSITAVPGTGATGFISVKASGGTASIAGFLYNNPPSILSFLPASGPIGTTLVIKGDYFNLTAEKNIVYFGPVKAQVKSVTKTQLEVIVPAGATGLIVVTNLDKSLSGSSNLPFLVTNKSGAAGFSNKLEIKFDKAPPLFTINDFDGDGKPDLLIAKDDSLYILKNSADPILSRSSFSQKIVLQSERYVESMVVGDVDGDGKKDILFSVERCVILLHNTSTNNNISFETKVLEYLDNSTEGMSLRDIDMDGRPDLIMGDFFVTKYYPNTSSGSDISFGPLMFLQNVDSSASISYNLTDIDGDNKPDPIAGSSYTGITIFKNDAVPGDLTSQRFSPVYILHSGYYYTASAIVPADFDGDNKPDIVENDFGSNQFLISRNISTKGAINTASFEAAKAFSNASMKYYMNAADMDGDGKIDLIASLNNAVYYARNQSTKGNISLANPAPLINDNSTDNLYNITANDMDGDGRMDIVAADGKNNKIIIYHNGPVAVPQITAVTPLVAGTDTKVTITGKYFDETSVVNFGTRAAKSFKVISPDTILAVVGDGETGKISIQNPDGAASFPGFVFVPAPTIASAVTATSGNGTLSITGTNLTKTTVVTIAGIPALSFTVNSDTNITATFTAISGDLVVTTPGGTATLLNVTVKINEIVSFTAVPDHTYGDDDFALIATSNNTNIPVTFSTDNNDVAVIKDGKLHIIKSGTVNIIASQAGDALNNPAKDVKQVLVINKKVAEIKVNDQNRIYGQANPDLTFNYAGFINGEDKAVLTTLPSVNTSATLQSPVGAYDIIASGAVAGNYSFNYTKGTLTVNKAVLDITADDATRAYSSANPVFNVIYSGFVNGDNADKLLAIPLVTTTANSNSDVGIYDLVPSGASSNNYIFNYNNGKLTITPAITNFKVAANSVTCKGENNGSISITATQPGSYTAVITGNGLNKSYAFTTNTTIDNLSPDTYKVCISDAALTNYNQCFDLVITEPKDLSVYSVVNKSTNTVSLALNGGLLYNVMLNGNNYETNTSSITLPLKKGSNTLSVTTDKLCQGKIEQIINVSGNLTPYPNPFQDILYINLGEELVKNATVKIYNVGSGSLKITKEYVNQSGVISFDVSSLEVGVYSLHLIINSKETVYKIYK